MATLLEMKLARKLTFVVLRIDWCVQQHSPTIFSINMLLVYQTLTHEYTSPPALETFRHRSQYYLSTRLKTVKGKRRQDRPPDLSEKCTLVSPAVSHT